MAHVAIIGAGVTGVTTAYSLLTRGHSVTVLERHRFAAMETSYANGGQLSASNAEVWNNPATLLKGIKWMFRRDAPLLLNPKPSWHKYSWLFEFACEAANYRANTLATVRLAIEARKHLSAIVEREKIDFDFERRGILHIYRDRQSFEIAGRVNEILREGGLDRRAVTPEEIVSIEPTIHGKYFGGFFTASDSTGDIHKFTRELANICVHRGAKFIFGANVDSVSSQHRKISIRLRRECSEPNHSSFPEDVEADAIVVCAGVDSRSLGAAQGDRINIYPVKGYSITVKLTDTDSRASAPWVSLLDEDAKIVMSRLGEDRLRVAGTAELNGCNRDIRSDRIAPLLVWVRQLFPNIGTEEVISWCGLRPMTPNMMPRVGAGRRAHVFYNTGHGHLGWTLCAATAELVADAVDDMRMPSLSASP